MFTWRRPENLQESFSQEGEDMILSRIFENHPPVSRFYVDVGAHHPTRFSNTYRFYRQRWNGINIEPNPDAARIFQKLRPRDINLSQGVSDIPGILSYTRFNEPALNTFDDVLAKMAAQPPYYIRDRILIHVSRLETILEQHVPPSCTIDFMNIDVEGRDLQVVRSNDWTRWRPRIVLVEDHHFDISNPDQSEIYAFMKAREYRMLAKSFNTLFFIAAS